MVKKGKKSRRGGTLDEIAEQLQLRPKGGGGGGDEGAANGDGGWKVGVSAMDDGAAGDGGGGSAPDDGGQDMEMADAVAAALKSRNKAGAKRKQLKRQERRLRIGGALGGGGGRAGCAAGMDTAEARGAALAMSWPTRGGVGKKRTGKRGNHTTKQARRAATAIEHGTAAAERRAKRHVQTISKKSVRGQAKTLY